MDQIQKNSPNDELAELGTHANGATDLQHTRTTGNAVEIGPPEGGGNPTPFDNRDRRFDNKKNGKPI